jgi:arylsulfatase A-like enzyme
MNPPNVVVFFTDQQRWDSTGLHGNPLELTPNFDRLASEGTHIAHSITCQPVCAPARSSLQTGQYATTTGVWKNGKALASDAVTLAKIFGESGYHTGYIGKWHLAGEEPVPEGKRGGYQEWLGAEALELVSEAYRFTVFDNDCQPVTLPGYRVDAQTDAAIHFIDRNKERPFFLFCSYLEPHHQNRIDDYPAPDGYRERYTGHWTPPDLAALGGSSQQHLGGYWGMVKRLDEALGRIMDALKSLDLDENTIVLFTSDHGCHFKTRNAEYKRSCHESSVRVPTFFHGPGFQGGGRIFEVVSLVDLPPTLLDAAGLTVPDTMQGRSILPLIRRQSVDWPEAAFIQISESCTARALRTRKWKYSVTAPPDKVRESGSSHYVETELYDLEYDPYELCNLIGLKSHESVAERLAEMLKSRLREVESLEVTIEQAPSRPAGQRFVRPEEMPRGL